jgi:outer membrane protein assembly factor BamD (BamD/ComL family)
MVNATTDNNSSTQGFLLRMGNTWLEQGELRQAIDVFLKITEEYPGSDESNVAKSALLTISHRYEKDGQLRLSLDVLERLEQATN